jgi:predicted Fe-Mo cluster-binding NifX family protein/membrane-associated protease RseP (regulator of RpoE activity)
MKDTEPQFCVKCSNAALAALIILIVIVAGWMAWNYGGGPRKEFKLALAAASPPTAPPVDVKAKMLHPYWGNCDKCHLTTGAGKPVSKVMAGPPITVTAKMTHEYWGNCQLCHKVTGNVQQAYNTGQAPARAAAFNKITSQSLGLKVQTVTAAMQQQFGLISEDGVLVTEVQPNSIAFQAGMQSGDEVLRINKARIESVNRFESVIADLKPGSEALVAIYRGKRRNLFMQIPDPFPAGLADNTAADLSPGTNLAAATLPPMTQNQIETMAEQFGVPKTQQSVTQALQRNSPGGVSQAAAVPPISQNRIETMAEQFGVPKTQQSVAQSLQRNSKAPQNQSAPAPPMTQNQIETLAEQLGVPKTQQAVVQALQKQSQGNARLAMANSNFGKVAVGSMGPSLQYQVSTRFGASPFFIVFDPAQNTYSSVANPNLRSLAAQDAMTGQYMVDLGVSNVIAGAFSPDAVNTLRTLRVTVYPGVTGPVGDVLSAYSAGRFGPMNPNPSLQLGGPTRTPFSAGVNRRQTLF